MLPSVHQSFSLILLPPTPNITSPPHEPKPAYIVKLHVVIVELIIVTHCMCACMCLVN